MKHTYIVVKLSERKLALCRSSSGNNSGSPYHPYEVVKTYSGSVVKIYTEIHADYNQFTKD